MYVLNDYLIHDQLRHNIIYTFTNDNQMMSCSYIIQIFEAAGHVRWVCCVACLQDSLRRNTHVRSAVIQPRQSAPSCRGVLYNRVIARLLQKKHADIDFNKTLQEPTTVIVPDVYTHPSIQKRKPLPPTQLLVGCSHNETERNGLFLDHLVCQDIIQKSKDTPCLVTESSSYILNGLNEIAMSVVYKDGSTSFSVDKVLWLQGKVDQFRQTASINRRSCQQVAGICIAYSVSGKEPSTMSHVMLPDIGEWVRVILLKLLETSTRIICYDVRQLYDVLLSHYKLDITSLSDKWHLLDVKIGAYLLDPDNPPSTYYNLLTHYNLMSYESGAIIGDMSRLGPVMVKLYHQLQEHCLWYLYENLEMKISPILADSGGLLVNTDQLLSYIDTLKIKIEQLEKEAHQLVGHHFSLTSLPQLREVLFSELKLDTKCPNSLHKTSVQKVTSTSESVLIQLHSIHPLPGLILEHRHLSKLKAFIDNVLTHTHEGVVRPSWLPDGTATGRLACCNPNMQAFPKKPCEVIIKKMVKSTTVQINIREAIYSRSQTSFMALDFKSIELRLLAHLSQDKALLSVLISNECNDVFKLLASQWFGLHSHNVTQSDREKAKRVVYAIIYGIGKEKLSEMLQISTEIAQELMTHFLKSFPGVYSLIKRTIEQCRTLKYCTTICGRKRWFPQILSGHYQTKMSAERQAVNFIVQGSAADICKLAMIKIKHVLIKSSPFTRLLLQIHDELLYEVPDEDIPVISTQLKTLLESPNLVEGYCELLTVPLEVRVSTGKNWSELQELPIY